MHDALVHIQSKLETCTLLTALSSQAFCNEVYMAAKTRGSDLLTNVIQVQYCCKGKPTTNYETKKTCRRLTTKNPIHQKTDEWAHRQLIREPERLQQNNTTRKTATKQQNQKNSNKTTEKTNFSETNHKLTAMEYTSQIIGQDCSNFVQVQNMMIIGRISLNLRL